MLGVPVDGEQTSYVRSIVLPDAQSVYAMI